MNTRRTVPIITELDIIWFFVGMIFYLTGIAIENRSAHTKNTSALMCGPEQTEERP